MPNLPSFRPRGNIGLITGREVAPTQAFLRYLDQIGRVQDTDNAAIIQNTQDIAANAGAINANATAISGQASAISALSARIGALENNTRTPAATTYIASAPAGPASTEYS